MKKFLLAVSLVITAMSAFSQEAFDLLRYSTSDLYGTARSMAMANAFGALGGEMTAIGINPAGLGIYRHSEISYTPVYSSSSFQSDFAGAKTSDNADKFMTGNFGAVCSYLTGRDNKLINYNWGVSYNRLKNFDRNVMVQGSNRNVSLLDNLVEGSTLENMAYNAYLLDLNYAPTSLADGGIDNKQYATESGAIDQWDFSYAFNYGYFLYMGFSVGIQAVDYQLNTYYDEFFKKGGSFRLQNELKTYGVGVNAKLGIILRPFPALRLGFAYHSPTYYDMVDSYDAFLASHNVEDDEGNKVSKKVYVSDETPDNIYYRIETPQHFVYSMALQLGRKGLLSVDYERISYATMKMRNSNGIIYQDVSADVRNYFQSAGNLHCGLEWRVGNCFNARCGYAHYTSPVKTSVEENTYIHTPSVSPQYSIDKGMDVYSAGIGFRGSVFFLDLAVVDQIRCEHFYPYYSSVVDNSGYLISNYADTKTQTLSLVATLGMRF